VFLSLGNQSGRHATPYTTRLSSVALNVKIRWRERVYVSRRNFRHHSQSLSAPATSTRARVYADTYYALFSPAKTFSSPNTSEASSFVFDVRGRSMSNGSGEPHLQVKLRTALCPSDRPFFGGPSEKWGTRETPRRHSLLQLSALNYLSIDVRVWLLRTSAGSHTVIANRDISPPLLIELRSFARTRDEQSQHSREARAGTDSRRD